jgi:tRNA A-37 threonylcarbamoyl transferase component Bud32
VKLIASGRASEIFDLGDGRVLRRFRAGGNPQREALVMEHARTNGYPVPHVLEVAPDSLVLERIEGPTMLAVLQRRPWHLRAHARGLAHLHRRLHEIGAPAGLAAAGEGDRLLHLDLHPGNVILSPSGPVVVDWTNARGGDPALDVALSWVICETSGSLLAGVFVRRFLSHFDRDEVLRALPHAIARRVADVNVTDRERERARRLLEG